MKDKKWCFGLCAASFVLAGVFTVSTLLRSMPPAQASMPQIVVPVTTAPPTTAPTVPTTEPTGPALWYLTCESLAKDMDAGHILVYDATQESMLFCSTDPTDRMLPASISKLYSALVALMYLEPEWVITAGDELKLVKPGSSLAYIGRGHKLTVEMLIEAMLLPSGNDAAFVLAAAAGREIAADPKLSGTAAVEVFCQEMNREALRLGLTGSHFANPDGYHDDDHYSCPQDVALMASLALKEPVIAKYIGLQQDSVVFESGQHITWYNTNRLLNPDSPYYSPQAIGMKTGSTREAGNCLLAAFQQGQRQIIIGIFGSENKTQRYADALSLLEAVSTRASPHRGINYK